MARLGIDDVAVATFHLTSRQTTDMLGFSEDPVVADQPMRTNVSVDVENETERTRLAILARVRQSCGAAKEGLQKTAAAQCKRSAKCSDRDVACIWMCENKNTIAQVIALCAVVFLIIVFLRQ